MMPLLSPQQQQAVWLKISRARPKLPEFTQAQKATILRLYAVAASDIGERRAVKAVIRGLKQSSADFPR